MSFILDAKGNATTPSLTKAIQINEQIDLFTRLQYPKYRNIGNSSQRTFAAAPFFKLSAAQVYSQGSAPGSYPLFPELTGYVNGFTITPGTEKQFSTILDVNSNPKRALQTRFYMNFDFVVMHETLPGWGDGIFSQSGDGFYYVYYPQDNTPLPGLNVPESGPYKDASPDASIPEVRAAQQAATNPTNRRSPLAAAPQDQRLGETAAAARPRTGIEQN